MRRTLSIALLTFVCSAYAIQVIGQTSISAEGVIESSAGGFKFPDGTIQTTAVADLEARVAELERLVLNFSPYEPTTIAIDCDVSESLTPVGDVLAALNPISDSYIIQVAGDCDDYLEISDFQKLLIVGDETNTASFGQLFITNVDDLWIENVQIVAPSNWGIYLNSSRYIKLDTVEFICSEPTADCSQAVIATRTPIVLMYYCITTGDWIRGVVSNFHSNVRIYEGSYNAEIQFFADYKSDIEIFRPELTPFPWVQAMDHSRVRSHGPEIESAYVHNATIDGVSPDATVTCQGAIPVVITVDGNIDLCAKVPPDGYPARKL